MSVYVNSLFLGAGAPLGLPKLVSVSHKKVSKSKNLFSLASTRILILVTRYLLLDTCYFTLVPGTSCLAFSPATSYLILLEPDISYLLLTSQYMFFIIIT